MKVVGSGKSEVEGNKATGESGRAGFDRLGPAGTMRRMGRTGKSSALVDTRVVYCGDNLEQLRKLPEACVDLVYIDPPFNSNRNYEVFWGETKERRAFEDRHASAARILCRRLLG